MKPLKRYLLDFFFRIIRSPRLRWELGTLTKEQAYERILTGYQSKEQFWSFGKKYAKTLSQYVDKNSLVLDIGCGIGRVEKFLAPCCKKIYAVDISRRMLHFARQEVPYSNVVFHRLDALKIAKAFPKDHFDLVFSLNTLQHIEKKNIYVILGAIHDVLKPKGVAYLQFLNFKCQKWAKRFSEQDTSDPAHLRFHTEQETKTLLSGIGFEVMIQHDIKRSKMYAICSK